MGCTQVGLAERSSYCGADFCSQDMFPLGLFGVRFLTWLTIMAGHSVGMHRLLIHHAFKAPLWLERLLVWLGTLVGMAGPFGVMRAHHLRDWHQKQCICPDHPAHKAGFWKDAWWQLHCRYDFENPPELRIETAVHPICFCGSSNAHGFCSNCPWLRCYGLRADGRLWSVGFPCGWRSALSGIGPLVIMRTVTGIRAGLSTACSCRVTTFRVWVF